MTSSPIASAPRTAAELRRAFLEFFEQRGHTIMPSAPLVPGDPTLLFTTAGMVQFKPYFSAAGDVPYTRAVSVQKCLRLTDLDNVGLTPRHDTFFEMLGNFSFGPRAKGAYFKDDAIAFAWEFVTKVLGLPAKRLFVSYFGGEPGVPRDDEAAALWGKVVLSRATSMKDRKIATRDARIIADHLRGLSFAIAEGALPGNEGAGYVLRRLLRRAVTRGRSRQGLALHEPFLPQVAEQVIAQFG